MSKAKDGSNKNPSEKVFLSCTAELYVNALLASRGVLVITEHRLRFSPGSLELLKRKDLHVDLKIEEIEQVQIVGIRRRLSVKTKSGLKLLFGGTGVRRAFMILIASIEDLDGTLDSQDLMLPSWDAYYYQGPLASPGEISINARNFRFVPSSALDALAGTVDLITIAMSEIVEARVKGRLDKRLVITTSTEEHIFSMSDLEQRTQDLSSQLIHASRETEPPLRIDGTVQDYDWAKQELTKWRPQDSEEEILLFGAVVYTSKQSVMRRGWLCLIDGFALFLPIEKLDDGPKPLVLPTLRISQVQSQSSESGELFIKIAGSALRFLPRGGDAFVTEFWRQWNLIPEVRAKLDQDNRPPRPITQEDDINRRESFRVNIENVANLSLDVTLLAESSKQSSRRIQVNPLNLSVGGVCFSCPENIPLRSEMKVKITMKDEELGCLGMVTHVSPMPGSSFFKVGVALPELLVFDEASLRNIVMQCQQFSLVSNRPASNPDSQAD